MTQPARVDPKLSNTRLGGRVSPTIEEKEWGIEVTYVNNGLYYMKALHLKDGGETDFHYHINEYKTLSVASGVVTLVTLYDRKQYHSILRATESWIIPPGTPHAILSNMGSAIVIEASTPNNPNDIMRIS